MLEQDTRRVNAATCCAVPADSGSAAAPALAPAHSGSSASSSAPEPPAEKLFGDFLRVDKSQDRLIETPTYASLFSAPAGASTAVPAPTTSADGGDTVAAREALISGSAPVTAGNDTLLRAADAREAAAAQLPLMPAAAALPEPLPQTLEFGDVGEDISGAGALGAQ